MNLEDRAFQENLIAMAAKSIQAGNRKILLVSPTGSGKTVIGSKIIKGALAKGNDSMFVAHRRELIRQTADKLRKFEVPHGIIMAGESQDPFAPVQVASIDTLASRALNSDKMLLPSIRILMIDEAHRSASPTYEALVNAYVAKNPDVIVIGLTATPIRTDGRGLGLIYDDMIVGPSIRELTELGFLVPVEYYAPTEPDLKGLNRNDDGDYSRTGLAERMDKPKLIGDIVEHYARIADGKRAVVFASSVAHSINLKEQFIKVGYRAAHIDAHTPPEERDQILSDLDEGRLDVICNCEVLTEGWDCPSAEVCILARPTKSISRYLQMVGRVLRPMEGKTKAIIIDHAGAVHEHGYVDDPVPWSLDAEGKIEARLKKKKEERQARHFTCEKCFTSFMHSRVCPVCGHELPNHGKYIETQDGELVRLDSKAGRAAAKKPAITREDRQQWYSMFLGYAMDKGHSEGWAAHKYKSKFKAWPNGLDKYAIPPSGECRAYITHLNIRYAKRRQGLNAA